MSPYGIASLPQFTPPAPTPYYYGNSAVGMQVPAAPAPVATPVPAIPAAPASAVPAAGAAGVAGAAAGAAKPGGFANVATDAINQIASAGEAYVKAKAQADILRNTKPVPEIPESVGAAKFTPPPFHIGTGALALG